MLHTTQCVKIPAFGFADTKPHYELLDGLRGVAALLVVFHHIFEGYAFAGSVNGVGDGIIAHLNHGYLAVDFFFLLSGFVIGYAYDDRWQRGFTLSDFFRRRLIRLHPMVVFGAVVGLVCFLLQGCAHWDGSNGPAWSLFFEYIGNILYGLLVHRLSTRMLTAVTALLGVALVWMTVGDFVGSGMFGVGWTLDGVNFLGGLARMLFPYSLGMLLSRRFRPVRVRGAFWLATVVMAVLFMVPYIPGKSPVCWNGVYEAVCIPDRYVPSLGRPLLSALHRTLSAVLSLLFPPYPHRHLHLRPEPGLCLAHRGRQHCLGMGGTAFLRHSRAPLAHFFDEESKVNELKT